MVVDVGGDCGAADHLFEGIDPGAEFSAPWVMPYEDHLPIPVCRGLRRPIGELWPSLKLYL